MSRHFIIKNAKREDCFSIKGVMTNSEIANSLWRSKPTRHFLERKERIERLEDGIGNIVAGFVVDENHVKGWVEHFVTDTGMILVLNHRTKLAVTVMIARPAQIERYYAEGKAPQEIVDRAFHNSHVLGLNY